MAVRANGGATATDEKPVTVITADNYYVVIMIDASHPENAFGRIHTPSIFIGQKYHNPVEEPGHALYYVVKNGIIQTVLSFGPKTASDAVWGEGTPDCTMKNMVYAFKYNLTAEKSINLIKETETWREKIMSGKEKYKAVTNDTCAETVIQILKPFISTLPKGKGLVGGYKLLLFAYAVTPYWLFEDYKEASTSYKIYPIGQRFYTREDPKKLIDEFLPKKNDADFVKW